MTQSQFVDALTNDIDGTAETGSSAIVEALTSKKGAAANEEGEADQPDAATAAPKTSAASALEEMQEKLRGDLATLVEEKEQEIQ